MINSTNIIINLLSTVEALAITMGVDIESVKTDNIESVMVRFDDNRSIELVEENEEWTCILRNANDETISSKSFTVLYPDDDLEGEMQELLSA